MAFISSNRLSLSSNANADYASRGPTQVISNGDVWRLNGFQSQYQLPKQDNATNTSIDFVNEDTYTTSTLGSAARTDNWDRVAPNVAMADGFLYYSDIGYNVTSGKTTREERGIAYARKASNGSFNSSTAFEHNDGGNLSTVANEKEGVVLAAGCGVVALGSWSKNESYYSTDYTARVTHSKYVEIWSAGFQSKLFRIYADDKRPYFGETVTNINADESMPDMYSGDDNFWITSVAIGCNRIIVGYAYKDLNSVSNTTGVPRNNEGLQGEQTGYAEIYSLDGRLLKTLRPQDSATSNNNSEFGFAIAIGNGYIAVGAPRSDRFGTDAGAVYVYDTNGSLIRTESAGQSGAGDGRFGTSIQIAGNVLAVGASNFDQFSGQLDNKGRMFWFNIHTGNKLNNVYSGSNNNDRLGSMRTLAVGGDIWILGDPSYSSGGINERGAVYIFKLSFDKDAGTEYFEQIDVILGSSADVYFGSSVAYDNGHFVVTAKDPSSTNLDEWIIRTYRLYVETNTDHNYTYSTTHLSDTLGRYNPWIAPSSQLVATVIVGAAGGGGGAGSGTDGQDGDQSMLVGMYQRFPAHDSFPKIDKIWRGAAGGTGGNRGSVAQLATPSSGGIQDTQYVPDQLTSGPAGGAGLGDDGTSSGYGGSIPQTLSGGGGGGGGHDTSNSTSVSGQGGAQGSTNVTWSRIMNMNTLSWMKGRGGAGGTGETASFGDGGRGADAQLYVWHLGKFEEKSTRPELSGVPTTGTDHTGWFDQRYDILITAGNPYSFH